MQTSFLPRKAAPPARAKPRRRKSRPAAPVLSGEIVPRMDVSGLPDPGPGKLVYGLDPATMQETIVDVEPDPGPVVRITWNDLHAYKTARGLETVRVIVTARGAVGLMQKIERTVR